MYVFIKLNHCEIFLSYNLSENSIKLAIRHIAKYGDTDIFPNLPMLDFLIDQEKEIVQVLNSIDLDVYNPSGTIEALSPKRIYSYRIVHQQNMLDSLLMLASVIEIAEEIEAKRLKLHENYACSYRLNLNYDSGELFNHDVNYKSWMKRHEVIIRENTEITNVICLDIADFYSRIYIHRLENLIDEIVPTTKAGISRYIKKAMKNIRSRQSFGLPIGSNAARILSELVLSDFDETLSNYRIRSSRYVDDFRVFISHDIQPEAIVGFFAETLYKNEGLTLNDAKTKIYNSAEYLEQITNYTSDPSFEALNMAISSLQDMAYGIREITEAEIQKIADSNLLGQLLIAFEENNNDVNKIRLLLKAIKLKPSIEACSIVKNNLNKLLLFPRELCLLIGAIVDKYPGCFDDFKNKLIEAVASPISRSVLVIRYWLLEIFVRKHINIDFVDLDKLTGIANTTNRHQLFLIRGNLGDKSFFRNYKTSSMQFNSYEIPYLLIGATCLPTDEYQTWINFLKGQISDPLLKLHADWLSKNIGDIRHRPHHLSSEHFT